MQSRIEDQLKSLGIELPAPGAPGGNYVPFVVVGDIVYLAGQVTRQNGKAQFIGKVGRDIDIAQGQKGVACEVEAIFQIRAA